MHQSRHRKGSKAFIAEHPECHPIIVSLDRFNRTIDGIEHLYVYDFFKRLWMNKII